MIQRIQSIYLLVAATCALLLFFVDIWHGAIPVHFFGATATAEKSLSVTEDILLILPTILLILLPLATIFLYKNRKLQVQLGKLNILLCVIFIAMVYFVSVSLPAFDTVMQITKSWTDYFHYVTPWIGTYLPLLIILFTFLANRAIRKDHNLVKEMDRLR